MKKVAILCCLLILAAGATGCVSAIKSDKIISVKERIFGIRVAENPATQIPEVYLGFGSIVYQMIPTSTNGTVYAPRYADTFSMDQGLNPFGWKVNENTAAGDVAIGTNNSSTAIIPKLGKPNVGYDISH